VNGVPAASPCAQAGVLTVSEATVRAALRPRMRDAIVV
jgi:hypothetical protein